MVWGRALGEYLSQELFYASCVIQLSVGKSHHMGPHGPSLGPQGRKEARGSPAWVGSPEAWAHRPMGPQRPMDGQRPMGPIGH